MLQYEEDLKNLKEAMNDAKDVERMKKWNL